MTVSRSKGPKDTATRYHSQYVRRRDKICRRCGADRDLQCAHIIGRRFAATRTHPDNGWALCGRCHYTVDNFAEEKMRLVNQTIGRARYDQLRVMAEEGVKTSAQWWREQAETLKRLLQELPE